MTLLEVSNKSFAAKADFVLGSIVPSVSVLDYIITQVILAF